MQILGVLGMLMSLGVHQIKSIPWDPSCVPLSEELRIDCHPDANPTKDRCAQRNCCWNNFTSGSFHRAPMCYFPQNYPGSYLLSSLVTASQGTYNLRRDYDSNFIYASLNNLNIQVISVSKSIARIRITDRDDPDRFEVPFVMQEHAGYSGYTIFEHQFVQSPDQFGPSGIILNRRSGNRDVIFDSTAGPLIYSDQLIQMSLKLPNQYVYGMGEHRTQFQISANWRKMSFWTRDQATVRDDNLYSAHPFLISADKSGNAFGYFMLNSNAMETKFTPMPSVTYRTIGGIIDMFVFFGPTADEVIDQYWTIVGKPYMAPYWSLGYHLSRWNYGTLANLQAITDDLKAIDFPYDVQWTDIDALEGRRIFDLNTETWADLPQFVQTLHSEDKKYISINDPGIACDPTITDYPTYGTGLEAGVYLKWGNGSGYLVGEVWPGLTVYPDWTHPNVQSWWTNELTTWNKTLPVDGLWIDMNEVSSFIYGSVDGCNMPLDEPLYVPEIFEEKLWAKTVCVSAIQTVSNQYNMHSLYGHTEAIVTHNALLSLHPGKRPFVLTRSSFSGSGKWTSKWGGDNFATFADMYYSITDIMNFNMFGFPLTGDDLCGFIFDTTPELCTRWHQLGGFYTFMRNHNNDASIAHDPTQFPSNIQAIMKQALMDRYSLLPYMYTLLYEASVNSRIIHRPLWFDYPKDLESYRVDTQFFIGPAMMVAPTLVEGATQVDIYFPWKEDQSWFEFPSGDKISVDSTSSCWRRFDAPLSKQWTFVRSGHMFMTHIITNRSMNAVQQRRNNKFRVYAALSMHPSELMEGSFFWDDGESLLENNNFTYVKLLGRKNLITIEPMITHYHDTFNIMIVQEVVVFGIVDSVANVQVDGVDHEEYIFNAGLDTLTITGLALNINQGDPHSISYQ